MRVSSTEVQNNFGKYLNIAMDEEVIVTRNGKDIVKMVLCHGGSIVTEKAEEYLPGGGKRKVTYEEFLELTENSELRYELIDGEVFLLASPTYNHQTAILEIIGHFYNWFKGKSCRPLTSPFDVTLVKANDNINVVQPDIIVICDTDKVDEKGKYKGIPTLAVEVFSESTRRNDMLKKLDLYMQTGVREYWMVDPVKKEIYVHTFEQQDIGDYRVYTQDSAVRSSVFEGLEIPLREIFTYK